MKNIQSFIQSGILEMFVLGIASNEEIKEVKEMAAVSEEVRKEIKEIEDTLKVYAQFHFDSLNNSIKSMILASVDYEERLKGGETPSFPPLLGHNSTIQDYNEWLKRPDMIMPPDFSGMHVKIIGYTPGASTAIVWIQTETPYETHTNEYEKFLVLEGTCDIIIDGNVHSLVPGNYMPIPLHSGHVVKVTSQTPCKVILQRIAA